MSFAKILKVFIILFVTKMPINHLLCNNIGGIELKPTKIYHIDFINFPINNSFLSSILFSLVVILFGMFGFSKKRYSIIPNKYQIIIERFLELIKDTINPIINNNKLLDKIFPIIISFFVFILIQNWGSLLPIIGILGFFDNKGDFFHYFRPANADINTTLALSLISFLVWIFFTISETGKNFFYETFGNKVNKKDVIYPLYFLLFFIFLSVGIIECFSIIFRIISLSFRLFGNTFGGESLISNIYSIFPYILPIPFYVLELILGLVQAFVFTLLLSVYIAISCHINQ